MENSGGREMSTFNLVQKAKFEDVFFKLSESGGNVYLCAYRHTDTGNWVLHFCDHQLNHWVLEAQRGGPRLFRTLDTLQKYSSDSLGSMSIQINDYMPSDLALVL